GDLRKVGVRVAGDRGGLRSARASVFGRAYNVRRASRGGDADDDVFASRAAAGYVTLAQFGGIFIYVGGRGESLGAAGHDVLHLRWGGRKCWRALRCIQRGNAARRAGADIDQAAAVAQRTGDDVDDDSYFRQRLFDGGGDLRVFVVDDPGNLDGGLYVESRRRFVETLRCESVKVRKVPPGRFCRGVRFDHSQSSHKSG